ncbi:MAG TPA: type II and III secretion system protein [Candidatus Acidoferrales bacterium]|nr:type II and III secretion system protein [Candidatus Acidoferrales bacterium]
MRAATATLPGRGPSVVAAVPVLQYIQSQQLPNGHVRILLQFSAPAPVRIVGGGSTADFILQFTGAIAAPTVPTLIPVNLGLVQSVDLAIQSNALAVAISLQAPVQPKLQNGPGNLLIVDVPSAPVTTPLPVQPAPRTQQQNVAGSGGVVTQIVRLRYADLSEVVGVLTGSASITPGNILNPQPTQIGVQQQPGFSAGQFGTGQFNTGQTFQPFSQYNSVNNGETEALGQRITDNIAIDRRLNAVILTGTRDQLAPMLALIAQLDVPVQSILLDTQVIEVDETGAKAIGLDYGQSTTTPLSRIFNVQYQQLNDLPTSAIAGALDIQSNIWALVTSGNARVLASPKILTQDGVAASILTGDSLPIRVTTPVGVGGVGAVSSQVEYINVGVTLQILPRVTEDGGVDANIFSQVSSVTGFDSSNDPQISTRQAQTKVNLVEGQTLVIGGLLQQQDIHNLQKIPILGDIPILGALFRYYTETKQNTNLVITVTPHVVPAPVSQTGNPGSTR